MFKLPFGPTDPRLLTEILRQQMQSPSQIPGPLAAPELKPGYRPSDPTFDIPTFTAIIMMEPHGKGTKYTALAMHKDEKDRNAHDRMGFSDGWSKALDQLVAAAKTM